MYCLLAILTPGRAHVTREAFKQGKTTWWDGPFPLNPGDLLLVTPTRLQRRSCSRPCSPSTRCSPWAGDPALCPPNLVTWFCSLPPSQANSWVPSNVMEVLLSSCPTTSSPFFKALESLWVVFHAVVQTSLQGNNRKSWSSGYKLPVIIRCFIFIPSPPSLLLTFL